MNESINLNNKIEIVRFVSYDETNTLLIKCLFFADIIKFINKSEVIINIKKVHFLRLTNTTRSWLYKQMNKIY